jgi:hypothetical protein
MQCFSKRCQHVWTAQQTSSERQTLRPANNSRSVWGDMFPSFPPPLSSTDFFYTMKRNQCMFIDTNLINKKCFCWSYFYIFFEIFFLEFFLWSYFDFFLFFFGVFAKVIIIFFEFLLNLFLIFFYRLWVYLKVFQKRVVCSKFDIYIFIMLIMALRLCLVSHFVQWIVKIKFNVGKTSNLRFICKDVLP